METKDTFKLEIVTPDCKVVDCDAKYVSVPGTEGEFGVLPGHTEFMTTLLPGEILYEDDSGKKHFLAVAWGYAEVKAHQVVILAENAERMEQIDRARAVEDREQWESKLKELTEENENFKMYQAKLLRASARISVSSRMVK